MARARASSSRQPTTGMRRGMERRLPSRQQESSLRSANTSESYVASSRLANIDAEPKIRRDMSVLLAESRSASSWSRRISPTTRRTANARSPIQLHLQQDRRSSSSNPTLPSTAPGDRGTPRARAVNHAAYARELRHHPPRAHGADDQAAPIEFCRTGTIGATANRGIQPCLQTPWFTPPASRASPRDCSPAAMLRNVTREETSPVLAHPMRMGQAVIDIPCASMFARRTLKAPCKRSASNS